MAKTKPNSKRKTRSDKFPLTLHPTGQYCKKIKGKLYYFGNNKKIALIFGTGGLPAYWQGSQTQFKQ